MEPLGTWLAVVPVYGVVGPWPSLVLGNKGGVAEPAVERIEEDAEVAETGEPEVAAELEESEVVPLTGAVDKADEPEESEVVPLTGAADVADEDSLPTVAEAGEMLDDLSLIHI